MVALSIIALNVLISLIGFAAFRKNDRVERFLFIPSLLQAGQNTTGFFLSHFSHANFFHLFLNMFSFISFAGSIAEISGDEIFILTYVAAGLGGDALVYYLRRNQSDYRCLGASGSVVGIIFAAIVYDPNIVVTFWVIPIPGPIFALGFLVLSVVLSRKESTGISHEAHAGGAVAGLLMAGFTAPGGLWGLWHYFQNLLA
ncbi:MAG: rhomboid family intramembrane serine protease [Spirochaetales bacterium]|nr:rhomboid family intramembrane serine protease [Spirochaetales bacterium]